MGRLQVVTEQVTLAAGKVGDVGPSLMSSGGWLQGASGAADETAAAGAAEEMLSAWSGVLPAYATSADSLAQAMAAAAACYEAADRLPGPGA